VAEVLDAARQQQVQATLSAGALNQLEVQHR
jgi:hypothetical protein